MTTQQPGALDASTDLLLVSNRATTTLNGSINNSTTSIVVADGSVFPASDFFITIDSEILFCSARTGNTLTVTRGQQGTGAAAHVSGDTVAMNMTAGHYETLRDAIIATQEGYMRRPSVHDGPSGIVRLSERDPLTLHRRFGL